MKQIIIKENSLFLINEELVLDDDLNGKIEHIATVAYDAILSLREGLDKYDELSKRVPFIFKKPINMDILNGMMHNWENLNEADAVYRAIISKNTKVNWARFKPQVVREKIKSKLLGITGKMQHPTPPYVTNWEPAKSDIENFDSVMVCKLTRMEVDGHEHSTMTSKKQEVGRSKGGVINLTGDENAQVKNRYYDLLNYQVSLFYIFNSPIPPINQQNYGFDRYIKIYINNDIDLKSIKQFVSDKIYQTLSILQDKNFDKSHTNINKIDKTLPDYIQYLIVNLWNKSFLDANASLANNTSLDSSWDAAIKMIDCLNMAKADDNEETWLKVGSQLQLDSNLPQDIKEQFINETQAKYNDFFNKVKDILPKTVAKQEQNAKLETLSEEPNYIDTKYGQIRIVMKNRNGKCISSIWMLKPDSNEMILKYSRAYETKKIVDKYRTASGAFDFIKGETINTLIPQWIQQGFTPITDKTFEECQRINKEKGRIFENMRKFHDFFYERIK